MISDEDLAQLNQSTTFNYIDPRHGGRYEPWSNHYDRLALGLKLQDDGRTVKLVRELTGGAEADPNGIPQNAPGAKNDAGKLLPDLVLGEFAHALEEVVRVGTIGARKYTPRGWLEVPDGQARYREAAGRHKLALQKGAVWDDGEGGTRRLHKGQVIWNLLAELELEIREGKYKERM